MNLMAEPRVGTVAIIDDDPVYQTITHKRLTRRELAGNVLIFCDGQEAIEFFRLRGSDPQLLPDLILLDLNMPIMDGWDFLDEYRTLLPQLKKKVAICVVTSSISPEDSERALNSQGVIAFISKPVSDEELVHLFHSMN